MNTFSFLGKATHPRNQTGKSFLQKWDLSKTHAKHGATISYSCAIQTGSDCRINILNCDHDYDYTEKKSRLITITFISLS